MYRRQMRMSQSQPAEPLVAINSRFIQHLAQIPAVFLVWNIATDTYHVFKTSNKFLNSSLTKVEKAAAFVSKKAEPIVKILEPQIKVVDDIALRGFEKLEKTIPVIAKQPERVIKYTKDKYNEMIESGLQKYEVVKANTITTARDISDASVVHSNEFLSSPFGEPFLVALNTVFDAYEVYLDRILPPFGEEGSAHAFGDREKPPVLERADMLTEKFVERFYKHSLLQLQNLRIRGKLTIYKLCHSNILHLHFQRV